MYLIIIWVVSEIRVPFWVRIVRRHPLKTIPKMDPNLENYPYTWALKSLCRRYFKAQVYNN